MKEETYRLKEIGNKHSNFTKDYLTNKLMKKCSISIVTESKLQPQWDTTPRSMAKIIG